MIDPIERYSKPRPVKGAGALGALGVTVACAGLYTIGAAILANTAQQAVAYIPPAPQPQYASRPVAPPPPAATPVPVTAAATPPVTAPAAPSQERYEAERAKIEAALHKGPFFAGTAYKEGEGESEVTARIVWDDVSKRASGEINLLTFNNKMNVEGLVAEDRSHPGQFVLRLQAPGSDCYYYLAPTESGQLAGTWQWNSRRAGGSIKLYPKPEQSVAEEESSARRREEVAAASTPTAPPQAMVAVQPASAPARAPAPQAPPPAARPSAPVVVAVPADTLIDVVTSEQIEPNQPSRTWYGKTTGSIDLNNGETIGAGSVVLLQLVRTGQTMGLHLVGVRFGNKLIHVKSEILPLNVKASTDPVMTQNGNTTTVHLDNLFRGLGNRVAANTPFSFTVTK